MLCVTFFTSRTAFTRYHTSSEANNLAKTSRGYACFKDLQAYRKYFFSVSMHCTVDGDPQDLFMKGINP